MGKFRGRFRSRRFSAFVAMGLAVFGGVAIPAAALVGWSDDFNVASPAAGGLNPAFWRLNSQDLFPYRTSAGTLYFPSHAEELWSATRLYGDRQPKVSVANGVEGRVTLKRIQIVASNPPTAYFNPISSVGYFDFVLSQNPSDTAWSTAANLAVVRLHITRDRTLFYQLGYKVPAHGTADPAWVHLNEGLYLPLPTVSPDKPVTLRLRVFSSRIELLFEQGGKVVAQKFAPNIPFTSDLFKTGVGPVLYQANFAGGRAEFEADDFSLQSPPAGYSSGNQGAPQPVYLGLEQVGTVPGNNWVKILSYNVPNVSKTARSLSLGYGWISQDGQSFISDKARPSQPVFCTLQKFSPVPANDWEKVLAFTLGNVRQDAALGVGYGWIDVFGGQMVFVRDVLKPRRPVFYGLHKFSPVPGNDWVKVLSYQPPNVRLDAALGIGYGWIEITGSQLETTFVRDPSAVSRPVFYGLHKFSPVPGNDWEKVVGYAKPNVNSAAALNLGYGWVEVLGGMRLSFVRDASKPSQPASFGLHKFDPVPGNNWESVPVYSPQSPNASPGGSIQLRNGWIDFVEGQLSFTPDKKTAKASIYRGQHNFTNVPGLQTSVLSYSTNGLSGPVPAGSGWIRTVGGQMDVVQ